MIVRWFRCPCRYRKTLVCLLVLVFLTAGCLYAARLTLLALDEMKCSESESISLLNDYCHQYHLGLLVGDLCPALCDRNLIQYLHCTNYRGGKHVFIVECLNTCIPGNTTRAILKTKNRDLSTFDEDEFYAYIRQFSDQIDSGQKALTEMMNNILTSELSQKFIKYNTINNNNVIEKFWQADYKQYFVNSSTLLAFARSLILLMNQSEFRMLRINQHLPYFPKIYGTCGPMYLVESSPPGDILEHEISLLYDKEYSFKERAMVALRILDVLYRIEEDMAELLQLCDVKGENFGQGVDRIKLIDVDTVFYDSILKSIIGGQNCSLDQDCHFFDCRGFCNVDKGQCESFRTNNNLQSVCEDVFLGKWLNTIGGLLIKPPSSIREKLYSVLDECAFKQQWEDGVAFQKPSRVVHRKLYNLLLQAVSESAD